VNPEGQELFHDGSVVDSRRVIDWFIYRMEDVCKEAADT
jgi:hypothetical protein